VINIFAVLLVLAWPQPSRAVKVGATDLPDTWQVDGEVLALNGAGVREYSFFRVPVYAGALYTLKFETNSKKILDDSTARVIHIKMLRNVNREDSVKAWTYYLLANCELSCDKNGESFQAALKGFQALVPGTRSEDTQTFVFRNSDVEWFLNGKKLGDFSDKHFVRSLLASWIGSVPTTEDLRAQLLGKKN
jgi:Chalcone isomerase-like